MKKLILGFLLIACAAQADIKISQLPLGSAASTNVNDSFPYVDSVASTTQRLDLSDLVNLPAMQTEFNLLVPSQGGNSGKCLGTNGSITVWISCSSSLITVVNGGDVNYSILSANGHIRDTTILTAQRTYTLPSCVLGNIGETHSVKNDSNQSFNLVLAGNGGDTIDHQPNYTLAPGGAVGVICAVVGDWDIRL
jgi:hypothetical protein